MYHNLQLKDSLWKQQQSIFFEIEIKYDSKGKFHAKNDGNIGFLWKQQQK